MPKPKSQNPVAAFLHKPGPGVITGAADDDPSGIATYSVRGVSTALSQSNWMQISSRASRR
jgi:Mn2+/Fe2+ NRAMP family transporter